MNAARKAGCATFQASGWDGDTRPRPARPRLMGLPRPPQRHRIRPAFGGASPVLTGQTRVTSPCHVTPVITLTELVKRAPAGPRHDSDGWCLSASFRRTASSSQPKTFTAQGHPFLLGDRAAFGPGFVTRRQGGGKGASRANKLFPPPRKGHETEGGATPLLIWETSCPFSDSVMFRRAAFFRHSSCTSTARP